VVQAPWSLTLSIDLAALRYERELPTLKITVFPRFIVSWSTRFDVTPGQPISSFSLKLLTIPRWKQGSRADVDIAIPANEGSQVTVMCTHTAQAFELFSNFRATKARSYLLMCTYVCCSFGILIYLPTGYPLCPFTHSPIDSSSTCLFKSDAITAVGEYVQVKPPTSSKRSSEPIRDLSNGGTIDFEDYFTPFRLLLVSTLDCHNIHFLTGYYRSYS
jgi:hypothetical protein